MHAIYAYSHSNINIRNADRQVSAYASITLVYRASVSSIEYVVSGSVKVRSNMRWVFF